MQTTKKIFSCCLLASAAIVLTTSCNNDWEEEQYAHYVSFKAPLNTEGSSVGVTTVYVPFTRYNKDGKPVYGSTGESHYNLPVIVSGSTTHTDDLTVTIAHSDTLETLNMERFSINRQELWYKPMDAYAEYPSTLLIPGGQDVGLLKIRFHFNNIDLADRYVLPLTVVDGPNYKRNPRKNYATAMLRVLPYTDYSGVFQATNMKYYIVSGGIVDPEPGGMKTVQTYTVDQNTVFFYAGTFDESSQLRKDFKIMARFLPSESDPTRGTVKMWCDNENVNFSQNTTATFAILSQPDEVQNYIMRRTLIVNDVDYTFTDYRSAPGSAIVYNIKGTMSMERKLNTQMPEEDQIIFE